MVEKSVLGKPFIEPSAGRCSICGVRDTYFDMVWVKGQWYCIKCSEGFEDDTSRPV